MLTPEPYTLQDLAAVSSLARLTALRLDELKGCGWTGGGGGGGGGGNAETDRMLARVKRCGIPGRLSTIPPPPAATPAAPPAAAHAAAQVLFFLFEPCFSHMTLVCKALDSVGGPVDTMHACGY